MREILSWNGSKLRELDRYSVLIADSYPALSSGLGLGVTGRGMSHRHQQTPATGVPAHAICMYQSCAFKPHRQVMRLIRRD